MLIFLALSAYFKVFLVSSNVWDEGKILQIMTVLQLPPNESCNNLVSFESLNGINFFLSTKELIHFDKANKDLLIFAPSLFKLFFFKKLLLTTTFPYSIYHKLHYFHFYFYLFFQHKFVIHHVIYYYVYLQL